MTLGGVFQLSRSLPLWSRRRVHPTVSVVAVAVAAWAAIALPTVLTPYRTECMITAGIITAPLLWRRRAPLTVGVIVGIATVVSTLYPVQQGMPHAPIPYPATIALYTIAELSPPLHRRIAIGVTVVGVLIAENAKVPLLAFGYSFLTFVTAYALGASVREYRARIVLLEQRARQLERARLTEAALAASQERARIARDVHDIVAHSVSSMVVQAEAGPVALPGDPQRAISAFEAIGDSGRSALAQLRSLLGTLRSATGPEVPNLAGLAELVDHSTECGLPATLTESGTPQPVSAETEVAAYRVVQESLTNARRHANASCVRVELRWTPGELAIMVVDDGIGNRGTGSNGHGVIGMRERAASCGGSLHVGDAPSGRGFAVRTTLPTEAKADFLAREPR